MTYCHEIITQCIRQRHGLDLCGTRDRPGGQGRLRVAVRRESDRPAGRGCGAGRLDWKYCLGLSLEDEGFEFSVLSEFRARLVAGSLEWAILDLLLDRLKGLGLVKAAGGSERTPRTCWRRSAA